MESLRDLIVPFGSWYHHGSAKYAAERETAITGVGALLKRTDGAMRRARGTSEIEAHAATSIARAFRRCRAQILAKDEMVCLGRLTQPCQAARSSIQCPVPTDRLAPRVLLLRW